MKLLHIISSPRKERSSSTEVAHGFIDALKAKDPSVTVDTLNVWETELLPFDGDALAAKYAGLAGEALTADQQAVWKQIEVLGARFHDAEMIVFSVPMWNYSIPYKLKHLVDVVSQKNILFTFDERGQLGLLGGRTMVVIASRGAALGGAFPAADFDHQTAYMSAWARMVGISDYHEVVFEKTLFGPESDKQARAGAKAEAVALAEKLASEKA